LTEPQALKGTIEQISFHNRENGYCVLKVNTHARLITLTARLANLSVGEEAQCQGGWVIHPKFGGQFQANEITTQPPSDLKLIEKHLSSGIIKGIRKISAENLVKAFGGFIKTIDKKEGILKVLFSGELNVSYHLNELDQLSLAYATTIHKAQGSEYTAIVMLVSTEHYLMLQRNLLYIGITRGKELVFIIGQPRALNLAIQNAKAVKRLTHLKERLR
jgi:ATP-dependent exoDNAse (exonuclease V) alpha subunit